MGSTVDDSTVALFRVAVPPIDDETDATSEAATLFFAFFVVDVWLAKRAMSHIIIMRD